MRNNKLWLQYFDTGDVDIAVNSVLIFIVIDIRSCPSINKGQTTMGLHILAVQVE